MTQDLLNAWMRDAKPNAHGICTLGVSGIVRARVLDVKRPGGKMGKPLTPWTTYPNGAVTVGLNKLLDVGFRNQTQITQWYMGLIAESGFSALSAADTAASHAGWSELTTYTSATRLAWSPNAASGGAIAITSAISFTTNTDSDIRGILVASSNTKSSAVDTLWATAVEGTFRTIASGQTYQCLYGIVLTPTS